MAEDSSSGEETEAGDAVERGERSAGFAEDLFNLMVKPFDLVVLTREKIQATLDEAAERGRVTRADADKLVSDLVRIGRQQTEQLLTDLTDRARRTVGQDGPFPIEGYDELTVAQVTPKLAGLTPAQLRRVRDFERRHGNRKSVLDAIEKALA